MVDRDIVLAKVAAIQRCLMRINQITPLDPARLDNQDIEDISQSPACGSGCD